MRAVQRTADELARPLTIVADRTQPTDLAADDSFAWRTSDTPWRPLTLTVEQALAAAPAGICQVHVATWPAISPVPLRRLPRERARQRT